ncbi:hypothetical protein QR680_004768 [Steinernema hermaphroditum]|uniref:Uncharacterized protein n=1 Tax=Steinernema hermaphroditum TaxID=289476 RepID=A0AA39LUI5_9BILA|nr:hypothetical protein QR680_004768 [Steinernema hermaphroditum]
MAARRARRLSSSLVSVPPSKGVTLRPWRVFKVSRVRHFTSFKSHLKPFVWGERGGPRPPKWEDLMVPLTEEDVENRIKEQNMFASNRIPREGASVTISVYMEPGIPRPNEAFVEATLSANKILSRAELTLEASKKKKKKKKHKSVVSFSLKAPPTPLFVFPRSILEAPEAPAASISWDDLEIADISDEEGTMSSTPSRPAQVIEERFVDVDKEKEPQRARVEGVVAEPVKHAHSLSTCVASSHSIKVFASVFSRDMEHERTTGTMKASAFASIEATFAASTLVESTAAPLELRRRNARQSVFHHAKEKNRYSVSATFAVPEEEEVQWLPPPPEPSLQVATVKGRKRKSDAMNELPRIDVNVPNVGSHSVFMTPPDDSQLAANPEVSNVSGLFQMDAQTPSVRKPKKRRDRRADAWADVHNRLLAQHSTHTEVVPRARNEATPPAQVQPIAQQFVSPSMMAPPVQPRHPHQRPRSPPSMQPPPNYPFNFMVPRAPPPPPRPTPQQCAQYIAWARMNGVIVDSIMDQFQHMLPPVLPTMAPQPPNFYPVQPQAPPQLYPPHSIAQVPLPFPFPHLAPPGGLYPNPMYMYLQALSAQRQPRPQ